MHSQYIACLSTVAVFVCICPKNMTPFCLHNKSIPILCQTIQHMMIFCHLQPKRHLHIYIESSYYTVWTLLHNQTNQTNSANLAICAAFLVVKIISSDHFLLLTIISSHSMSIKSKKLEFFPKFQKFALWISWFNFAYNSKTGAFLCKPSWIYFKYIKM